MSKFKLDEIDHQILEMLIENTRIPFTDIAKKLLISAGTVHVRVKKMEDYGLIKGSSLILDYDKLGYTFIAYVGLYVRDTSNIKFIIERIKQIPNVTVAHITTGKFNVFCKIRAKGTTNAKNIMRKGICVMLEMIMRYFNESPHNSNKMWFFDVEQTLANDLPKL